MRTASPNHTAPSGFKKWAAAALLAGGLGVTGLALAGPASAQDNTSTTAKTEQTQPTQADAGTASNKVGDQADRPGSAARLPAMRLPRSGLLTLPRPRSDWVGR